MHACIPKRTETLTYSSSTGTVCTVLKHEVLHASDFRRFWRQPIGTASTMTSALLSTFSCCEAFLCLDTATSDSASILAHHRGEDEKAQSSSSYKPKPRMERQSPSQRKTTTSLMDETTTNNETTTTGQGDPTEDMDDDSNNNENNSIDNLDDALANMGTYIVE